jgi:hypothetical protein
MWRQVAEDAEHRLAHSEFDPHCLRREIACDDEAKEK